MIEENQRSPQNEQNKPEINGEQDTKAWEVERTTRFLKSHLTAFFNEKLREFDEPSRKGGDETVRK